MDGQRSLDCDKCGGVNRFVLHNIRYLNDLRRFCTACVLKTFPESFCSVCFRVFETLPPPPERWMCTTDGCRSVAHWSCTVSGDHGKKYECRHCKNRNPNFFELKSDGARGRCGKGDEIDLASAGRLFAAASISSASMKKAALFARAEAERRAGEALVARRNAKEALEKLASISNQDVGENDQNGSNLMNRQLNGAASEDNGSRRRAADGESGSARVMSAGVNWRMAVICILLGEGIFS
ncbi:hypothetical protein QQ045_032005 [Rhodiola kirilowii]